MKTPYSFDSSYVSKYMLIQVIIDIIIELSNNKINGLGIDKIIKIIYHIHFTMNQINIYIGIMNYQIIIIYIIKQKVI